MAHVSGVAFKLPQDSSDRLTEYATVIFSIGHALQKYGAQTALAPPQRDVAWVLSNKPAPQGDNSWPPEAAQGLEGAEGHLKAVFEEAKIRESLTRIVYLPGEEAFAYSMAPQRVPKSLLLAIRPSPKSTLPLGLGSPIVNVAIYSYASNELLWECQMSGKPYNIVTETRMFEHAQTVGHGFTVMHELLPLLKKAGYLGPELGVNLPRPYAYPTQ